jgi:hypothetical protein
MEPPVRPSGAGPEGVRQIRDGYSPLQGDGHRLPIAEATSWLSATPLRLSSKELGKIRISIAAFAFAVALSCLAGGGIRRQAMKAPGPAAARLLPLPAFLFRPPRLRCSEAQSPRTGIPRRESAAARRAGRPVQGPRWRNSSSNACTKARARDHPLPEPVEWACQWPTTARDCESRSHSGPSEVVPRMRSAPRAMAGARRSSTRSVTPYRRRPSSSGPSAAGPGARTARARALSDSESGQGPGIGTPARTIRRREGTPLGTSSCTKKYSSGAGSWLCFRESRTEDRQRQPAGALVQDA